MSIDSEDDDSKSGYVTHDTLDREYIAAPSALVPLKPQRVSLEQTGRWLGASRQSF